MAEDLAWTAARASATALGTGGLSSTRASATVPLAGAIGRVLAEGVHSSVDLPPFDTSAMDGWAVRGRGPWTIVGDLRAGDPPQAIEAGESVRISTGAVAPLHSGVLRSEWGSEIDGIVSLSSGSTDIGPATSPDIGADIRRRGEEVRVAELILSSGQLLTPPAIGLAAAAGHDLLEVVPLPRVAVLILGDELAHSGPPIDSQIRDALAPQLPGWVDAMGAELVSLSHVPDSLEATRVALSNVEADVVITTGGTGAGAADHLRTAVEAVAGRWLVDGVAVRPGHPMKLAELPGKRALVALPGNPLAAVSALVTLVWPLLDALAGRAARVSLRRPLAVGVDASPTAHRLVPGQVRSGVAHPTTRRGPAMLSGMATADLLIIIAPGSRSEAGSTVDVLPLPWGSGLLA